jgi:adhesin transport system outer membrane protein
MYQKLKYGLVFILLSEILSATTLREAVQETIRTNPKAMANIKSVKAYKSYIDEEEAGLLPVVDLELFYEAKKVKRKPDGEAQTVSIQKGTSGKVDLEQVVYDNGEISSKIDAATYRYKAERLSAKHELETIVLDAINSYLSLVKYQELLALAENNLKMHEDILNISKENERVSGETIDRIQAESRTQKAYSVYALQKNERENSLSEYIKVVGKEPKGLICRPSIEEKNVPSNVEVATKDALRKSYEIKEYIEKIKEQRAKIREKESTFSPNLKLKFSGETDNDVVSDEMKTTTYSSRLFLDYNIFNGGKDLIALEQEKLFLQKNQKMLDDKFREIIDATKQAFSDYKSAKQRIDYLENYVYLNKEIVKNTKGQFDGGEKTIMDLLNAKDELYSAKKSLIEEEFKLYEAYYRILNLSSLITDKLLIDSDTMCTKISVDIDSDELSIDTSLSTEEMNIFDLMIEENSKKVEIKEVKKSSLKKKKEAKKVTSKKSKPEVASKELEQKLQEKSKENMLDDILSSVYEESDIQIEKKEEPTKKSILKPIEKSSDKKRTIEFTMKKKTKVERAENSSSNQASLKSNIDDNFLSLPPTKFTINLATFTDYERAIKFSKKYPRLKANFFIFEFDYEKQYTKVIYGVFDTENDALEAISLLPLEMQLNRPYPSSMVKMQALYNKYHK